LIAAASQSSAKGNGHPAKHGERGKRGWKKLHLGVDDAKTGLRLIEDTIGNIASVTADAAYDTIAIYEAARARGAKVVIPPIRTAKVTRRGPRSSARDRTIVEVARIGRRQWQKESGYHLQGESRTRSSVTRESLATGCALVKPTRSRTRS
jgi:hypothetical protein